MRYTKNENTLSPAENLALRDKHVAVIGCGGLGGYVIEQIARVGVGTITAMDYDVFDESNLNRQLYSDVKRLGTSKVKAAQERIAEVNPDVVFHAVDAPFAKDNATEILLGVHLVIDCLDSVSTRLTLEKHAHAMGIPLVHGAIAGWFGQVGISRPGDWLLKHIYGNAKDKGVEQDTGNPPFTPACIASIQVAEAVKLLVGKEALPSHQLWYIDLLDHDMEIIEVTSS